MLTKDDLKEIEPVVEDLRYVCSKIIQAYNLRMQLFMKRYDLLASINKDFSKISDDFYTQLNVILWKEKQILKIIEGDEKKVGNNLAHALSKIENYRKNIKEDIQLQGWAKSLSAEDLATFLERMLIFLKEMQKSITDIEERIDIETVFIKKKNHTDFNKFIDAWESEVNAYEKMLRNFNKVLNSSQKIIHQGEASGDIMMAGGVMGGVVAAMGGYAGDIGAINIGTLAGMFIVMVGFVIYLTSTSKSGFEWDIKEKNLIEDFKNKRRAEKHSFWSNLFNIN